jgi:hypothetical protein
VSDGQEGTWDFGGRGKVNKGIFKVLRYCKRVTWRLRLLFFCQLQEHRQAENATRNANRVDAFTIIFNFNIDPKQSICQRMAIS